MIARIAPPCVTARHRVGRVAGQAVGGRLDAVEEAAQAFAAGKGEIELEGRPAIDQRGLFGLQVLEAVVFPAAEVDLAQIAVDLHVRPAAIAAAVCRQRRKGLQKQRCGSSRRMDSARARACWWPAASRGGSLAPTRRPTCAAPSRACRTKTRRWAIAGFPNKKSPSLEEDGRCTTMQPAPSLEGTHQSTFWYPDFRIVLLAATFPSKRADSGQPGGVRHRLQWRGRAGFSPASQFQRNRFRIERNGGRCQEGGGSKRAGGVSRRIRSNHKKDEVPGEPAASAAG